MLGGMQDWSLRVTHLIDHAARECGNREILTRWADGTIERTNWTGVASDARRLAQGFAAIGLKPGDRVATLAMNHHRHLATWYGAIGFGGVIHTINTRLFDEDLIYIMNHAEDQVLLYDAQFQGLVDRLKPQLKTIRHFIVFDDPDGYPAFVARQDGNYEWHQGDERDPCMLCYTSGTTGNPKGVLYQHRSTMLHAMAEVAPGVFDLSATSVLLPVVPMFHAASWGLPFAGAAAGVKFVFSVTNDAPTLHKLMLDEGVTHSAGVPTVWLAMFQHLDATGAGLGKLRLVTIGGSAAPRAMIERLMKMGVRVAHAWGMTETSPIISVRLPQNAVIGTVGPLYKETEIRLIDIASGRTIFPGNDYFGKKGELHIKGPQVMVGYYKNPEATAKVLNDGWMNTGDVAILTANGCLKIVGRSKETIVLTNGENVEPVPIESKILESPYIEQCMVVGQDQKFLGLLVVPRAEALKQYGGDLSAIAANEEAKKLIRADIARLISGENGFKAFERIGGVALIGNLWEKDRELTAKLSLRRHVITEMYANEIARMYQ